MAKTLVYQLYPLSWKTGFGGMAQHLSRIATLGADYVWLSPIYDSQFEDGGYDVVNYKHIARRFEHGRRYRFRQFVERAHDLGLGVLMDLPINHTSTAHRWFDAHPEYYCWSQHDHHGWHNLFNGGPAWHYLEHKGRYYLHLFHPAQADLNWFPNGGDRLNQQLVSEFRDIVDYWVSRGVDGFRLDFPQGINKNFSSDTLELESLLFGDKAPEVINAIFKGHEDLFLMMECFDPTMGELVEYYADNTPVDFICNVLLKDEVSQSKTGLLDLVDLIDQQARNPHYMLELESHDAPRFPSRGISPEDMVWCMFNSGAEGICLYQGQELGLGNPSKEQLPDARLMELDVQTAMRYIKGEELDDLRPLSRANARVRLPLKEYERQEQDNDSCLNYTKEWVQRWRDEPPIKVYPPRFYPES